MIKVVDLDAIFGPGEGAVSERAKRSTQQYVRSQVQIGAYREGAKGRVLSAFEVLVAYGEGALSAIHANGAFPLIARSGEPAATLKGRREEMGIEVGQLSRAAGVSEKTIRQAETPDTVVPVRDLEAISRYLALDERMVGHVPKAKGDQALGVRLRELKEQKDAVRFNPPTVLKLAEAAWVISKQATLAKACSEPVFCRFAEPDTSYHYPAWQHGFRLAAKTRDHLGLGDAEPVKSLRTLLESQLAVPVVQQDLGTVFAGATLANGKTRGVVVNQQGANSNVWVRRMTLCHELGHLLWDDDNRLNRLTVDSYADLNAGYGHKVDPVEIRANAFAVAFLAPPSGVKELFRSDSHDGSALTKLCNAYGISFTAAKYHAANVLGREVSWSDGMDTPLPSDEWEAAENMAVDYFPIKSTPITRRGRFAWLVANAAKNNLISFDTAASHLNAKPSDVRDSLDAILDLTR
nr:XRE family transcriptional regulator [Brevundimonas naejangsanensis]